MKLTDYTDYSIRILIYVGLHPEKLVTVREIADTLGLSRNHLVKVVHALGKEGYLETVRGRYGGLRLARAPAQIRIGDVIRSNEVDFDLVECFNPERNQCALTRACALRGMLRKALGAYFEVLDHFTLADLIRNPAPLSREISRHAVKIHRKNAVPR